MKGVFFKYGIIVFFLLITVMSCKKDENNDVPPDNGDSGKLEKVKEYDISVKEPSGLCFGPGKNTLLTVSDNSNNIYEITLTGNIIRQLDYTGDDLEGITYSEESNIIAVTEERKREVVFIDYNTGNETQRYEIATGGNIENKGPEGISYNPNNDAFYIVNEDSPGEMIIWNKNYGIINKTDLNFADDYSGIFVDSGNALLWILSDESKALFKCDYNGIELSAFPLEYNKYEGVAVDTKNNLIYLVNDRKNILSVYKIVKTL